MQLVLYLFIFLDAVVNDYSKSWQVLRLRIRKQNVPTKWVILTQIFQLRLQTYKHVWMAGLHLTLT